MKKRAASTKPSTVPPSRAQLLKAMAQIEAANHQQLQKLNEALSKHAEQNKKALEGLQEGLEQIYERQLGFDKTFIYMISGIALQLFIILLVIALT